MGAISVLFVLILLSSVDSARILMSQPFGSKSHQNSFVPLIEALSQRGHHITYITTSISSAISDSPNVTQLVLQNPVFHGASFTNQFDVVLSKGSNLLNGFRTSLSMVHYPVTITRSVFEDVQIKSMLARDNFDLVLISQAFSSSGYALAWHFQAPFILVSPNTLFNGIATVLGDSEHTEYVPFILSPYSDHMNLVERFLNTLFSIITTLYDEWHQADMTNIVRRVIPNCPPLYNIQRNVSLVFTNSHPIFNYPRALPPQVVEVGAMHCRPPRPLPEDLDKFVSSSAAGFILFSVGSANKMSDMPDELMETFIRVFSRLPQRVIWQWSGTLRNDLPKNIKTLHWLPQQDLLGTSQVFTQEIVVYISNEIGHVNCRLFLTHGGLNSLQEAVYHGVPVLGLPLGGDQELNLIKAVKEGYALKLQWKDITEDSLSRALDLLLKVRRYSDATTRLSSLLRDQAETPLERAVYWTEHVLRHNGTEHLQLGSRDLSSYQRALVDVYALIIFVAFLPIIILSLCLRKCCSRTTHSQDMAKKNQ